MPMMAKKTTFLIIIFLIFNFLFSQTVSGIGMMTKPIVIENVLRGQEVTALLNLYNSQEKAVNYQLKGEGEIANWATFYKIDDKNLENPIQEIEIPPNSPRDVIVKFQVPEDIPNGQYIGQVAIVTAPEKTKESGKMTISLRQKVGRKVVITVTDEEVINFKTTVIPLKYNINKGDFLKIKVIYNNQGNILIKPDLQLKIIKNNQVIFNAIFPYPEGEDGVKPFKRKVFPNLIEWSTAGQTSGRYQAEIKVLLNGQLREEKNFSFKIVSLGERFLAAVALVGGGNLTFGWVVIGGILVIISAILAIIRQRPQFWKIFWIRKIEKIKNWGKSIKGRF